MNQDVPTVNPSTNDKRPNESAIPPYGSPEWLAVDAVAKSFQSSADRIREGREKAGHAINNRWNDWYNSLMVICFTLGGALIAVASAITFKLSINHVMFWAGDALLLSDGLYILLLRKGLLESESIKLIGMGYELEYYSLLAKNRILDILKGRPFKQKEYEKAKEKLLTRALGDLDNIYEESRSIDNNMDVMTVIFIGSIELLILSSIHSMGWLSVLAIAELLLIILLLFVFRKSALSPKETVEERDKWLNKINQERK